MKIHGINGLTLLDYPGKMACTIFTGHCNFRCQFCHNATLVLNPESQPLISEEAVFELLTRREGRLEGVAITGGEPTLNKDLPEFCAKIKEKGLLVKLDTNGYNPGMVKELTEKKLVDCIAMDIKASPENYALTTGLASFNMDPIFESVDLIMECVPEDIALEVSYSLDHTVALALVNKKYDCDLLEEEKKAVSIVKREDYDTDDDYARAVEAIDEHWWSISQPQLDMRNASDAILEMLRKYKLNE